LEEETATHPRAASPVTGARAPPVPKIVERQLTALMGQGFHPGGMLING
jgi:hypothetical protein